MIAKTLFLFAALFIQEWVLLNTLLLAVHNGLYAPVLIFILFLIATAIDIVIGFYVGAYLRNKTSETKAGRYIRKISERFAPSLNTPRRWLTLLVLENFSFCYINATVTGYLNLPFWETSAYNFFGNALSYILVWYAIIGISSIIKNVYLAAGAVVILSLAVIFALRKLHLRKM